MRDATPTPETGQLVRVRDRHWVVADVRTSTQPDEANGTGQRRQSLLTLTSVEDDAYGEELQVIWELEPGTGIEEQAKLPVADPEKGFDDPNRLDAFIDAIRWGAITSADLRVLQAPYWSGISIDDYQLEPVVRALRMPRVNLLIADDVGLGKTIEAGLVVQELLLRHRARTCLVVCPASLCVKWKEEMWDKFGLDFRIVDSDLLRELRRSRGLYANPWTHFPRLIVSVDWLKRDRPMQLMRDVLPSHATYPREFDLLIVDEVHTAAPSGYGKYATDSLRTRALREIGPHFEHRLFLSATPHNGHRESFTALLELLDDQRFARGVAPNQTQLREAMVRRLKSELPPHPDGTPRFPERQIIPLEVDYTDEERRIHQALKEYSASRAKAAESDSGNAGRVAAEFVLTLLKKRLFSSPAAFASTLDKHLGSISGRKRRQSKPSERILNRAKDEVEQNFGDDDELEETWDEALRTAEEFNADLTDDEQALLREMETWAHTASNRGDTKAAVLCDWIESIVRPEGEWSDERVIVFTEYRDTQNWLAERLAARDLAGDRLALLYGGMDTDSREDIKARFQASSSIDPVRILLATDAASEGIDLQRHCNRLVHYEIPWNPNRLEQRNGRIDRHGQPAAEVLIHHFVGSGWEHAEPGSIEADLQFLYIAAEKVEAIRDDLGNVGPVIAQQVEEAMLGKRRSLETGKAEEDTGPRKLLRLERNLREEIAKLRETLDESIDLLNLTPETIERVVRVGLELARQPSLRAAKLDRPVPDGAVFEMPQLTGSWAQAATGLEHPVTGQRRPITFSHEIAAGHDDVVLVHLGHRLVQQCLRLLRAEVWQTGPSANLTRITARVVPDDALDELVACAYGRLVVTGADGRRLHEEVITAGGRVRNGNFARMNVGETDTALSAPDEGDLSREQIEELMEIYERVADPLSNALEYRARTRAESLENVLEKRADEEVKTITAVLQDLQRTIEAALDDPEFEQLRLELPSGSDQREQLDRDIDALRRRIEEIPEEIEWEIEAVHRRYASTEPRWFPAAVTFLVPERLARR